MMVSEAEKMLGAYRDELRAAGVLAWAETLTRDTPDAEVYLVGGAVRDRLLGMPDTKDYDFVVRDVVPERLEKHLKKYGVVNYVGRLFGVYKLRVKDAEGIDALDIALPRTEHAWGTGKYKDVDTQSDPALPLEKDLARRDFTINAMAMRVGGGSGQSLVDSVDGLKDLNERALRTVGNPEERFQEDYSRALRALRFSAQLGFEIEEDAWNALVKTVKHLLDVDEHKERIISAEIIAKEFLGALKADPVKTFDLYADSGAFATLMPEVMAMQECMQPPRYHSEGDVWVHTRTALEKLMSDEFKNTFQEALLPTAQPLWDAELALTVLLHDVGKPPTRQTPEEHGVDRIRFNDHDRVGAEIAKSIIDRMKLTSPEKSGVDAARVVFLIRHHLLFLTGDVEEMRPATIEKYFFKDPERGERLLKLSYADGAATVPEDGAETLNDFHRMVARINALKEKGRQTLPQPLLTGNEVMALLQIAPGKEVGEVLVKLREAQLEGKVDTKEKAIDFLKIVENF